MKRFQLHLLIDLSRRVIYIYIYITIIFQALPTRSYGSGVADKITTDSFMEDDELLCVIVGDKL